MFRGGRRGNKRRGGWGGQRGGRGNFKRFGNKNQQQQQQPSQDQQMYMPQGPMAFGSSGPSGFMNGMDRFNFLNNDAMENRDTRFSTDDYMEHSSPFKTDMTQMTSFQSAPMQQMPAPARGKKKNRQKRQREDSQSSNGFMGANMMAPSPMHMMNQQMALNRPNRPPFMAQMTPFQMPMQHAGMFRFDSPFGSLSSVKKLKMDSDVVAFQPAHGQGQSKKAQRRKRLRLKQQMESEAKKEEEEAKTDDVEETKAKEEVTKKPEDGSPKKERKFRRKNFFWKWEQKPFYCHYCRTDTQSFQGLEEHVKTPEHEQAVKDKDQRSKMTVNMIYERNEQRVQALMMMGKTPKFCSMCMLKYCGPIGNHKSGRDHQTMIRYLNKYCASCDMHVPGVTQMDKHNITMNHIRNFINRSIMNGKLPEEDLDVEEYNAENAIGRNYVVDTRTHYCQACDLHMKIGETDVLEHCKTAEHFEKFREFAKVRKIVEEERKREKEAAEEEQRKNKEVEEAIKLEPKEEEEKEAVCQENGSEGGDEAPMEEGDSGAIEQEAAVAESAE